MILHLVNSLPSVANVITLVFVCCHCILVVDCPYLLVCACLVIPTRVAAPPSIRNGAAYQGDTLH